MDELRFGKYILGVLFVFFFAYLLHRVLYVLKNILQTLVEANVPAVLRQITCLVIEDINPVQSLFAHFWWAQIVKHLLKAR